MRLLYVASLSALVPALGVRVYTVHYVASSVLGEYANAVAVSWVAVLTSNAGGGNGTKDELSKIDRLFPDICAIVEGELRSVRADYGALRLSGHSLKGLCRGYAET